MLAESEGYNHLDFQEHSKGKLKYLNLQPQQAVSAVNTFSAFPNDFLFFYNL